MNISVADFAELQPYNSLPDRILAELAPKLRREELAFGTIVYRLGDALPGLFTILAGSIEVRDETGAVLSVLHRGQSFGERGLLREGRAVTEAVVLEDSSLLILPRVEFDRLRANISGFERYFKKPPHPEPAIGGLSGMPLHEIVQDLPATCEPSHTVRQAAAMMREKRISCLPVLRENELVGIVTESDLTERVLAVGVSDTSPVAEIMSVNPRTLSPRALVADALFEMLEHELGHIPIVDSGRLVGILTQTDLIRSQAVSSAHMRRELAAAQNVGQLASIVGRIPQLLSQLVSAALRHEAITRMITDIADATTRRLLVLAEAELGPPPVPYLWLACGSQGRREQTGVSDQDNCLFLHETAGPEHDAYFLAMAEFVRDGLAACGYFRCPGDMMATNAKWRQPVDVWRGYFQGWVRKPDPMAQMLASVMFDLRPISGEESLFMDLQLETLSMASANSIFVAHMIANSIKHSPALGLFGGFATQRDAEHKGTIDLKLNGVVPIVDLARIYAIQGRLIPVGTRARLLAAQAQGIISSSGGRDLIDAYDLIAEIRLKHQLNQIRGGAKPDNFLKPDELSDLEQHHLRDAFVVVRTMQSALGQGKAAFT